MNVKRKPDQISQREAESWDYLGSGESSRSVEAPAGKEQRRQSRAPSAEKRQGRRQRAHTETWETAFKGKKKPSTVRVLKHWMRLPKEVVEIPFSELFRTPEDRALRNPALSRGLGLVAL